MSIRTPQVHPSTRSAELLAQLRTRTPLVQCITNAVVTGFTANVLLAVGAAPAMCDLPREAGVFAGMASGLLVNLGTPHAEQREAMVEAVDAAHAAATPWVLDPVAIGVLPVRTELATVLLARRPSLIRGNASEILALVGHGSGGRGVDTTDPTEAARGAAEAIARATGGAVAVSGPVDIVTDGTSSARIANGHALLTRVTGGGCALGAVMAAFLGAGGSPFESAIAASAFYGLAAERASATAMGPGSFAVALLDVIASITPEELAAGARIR